jgi:hypothetical protein
MHKVPGFYGSIRRLIDQLQKGRTACEVTLWNIAVSCLHSALYDPIRCIVGNLAQLLSVGAICGVAVL